MDKHREYIEPAEATRIRVFDWGGGEWAIDAADERGNYVEFCWNRDGSPERLFTRERAIAMVPEFAQHVGLPSGIAVEVEAIGAQQ